MTRTVKVAVAPETHEWYAGVRSAVDRTDAVVTDAADAEALVWLGKHGDDLREYLHDGIKWVQLRAAGVEYWFETGEIDDKRVFTCSRGAYGDSVGEHAVALILAAARKLHFCARAKEWDRVRGAGRVLRGATVGIIGAGGIGQRAIEFLQPFGPNIIAVTRSGREVEGANESRSSSELDDIWPRLDFAVILAPATADTEGLVDKAVLDALPEHAWVLNLARGTLVDTDALVDALRNGDIGGAALDVTEPEPLPTGHALWDLPNALITPHAANPKSGQHHLLEGHITENVERYLRGDDLLAVVDLEFGY